MMSRFLLASDPGILPVVLMGTAVVFAGIIIIIMICKLLSLVGREKKKQDKAEPVNAAVDVTPDGGLAAAIGAAVAEECGTDVKNIKIVSIKRVN